MALWMAALERPASSGASPILLRTFVARIMSLRRGPSALPRIVSATPQLYMLAVSKKLMPASRHSSTKRVEAASPACEPKVIVPNDQRETFSPVWGSMRYSILSAFFQAENPRPDGSDRKSTRLNSSHLGISYAVFCLKKKKITKTLIK